MSKKNDNDTFIFENIFKISIPTNTQKSIFFLLYGKFPQTTAIKRSILAFKGYDFEKDSDEYSNHVKLISRSICQLDLEDICKIFKIKYSPDLDIIALTKLILNFLYDKLSAEATHRRDQSDSISSKSKSTRMSKTTSNHSRKITKTQKEIQKLRSEIVDKEAEVLDLEYEVEIMKQIEEKTEEEVSKIKQKEKELTQKNKLLKITQTYLKRKEDLAEKQSEILSEIQEESSSSSSEEIEPNDFNTEKQEEIQTWINDIDRQPLADQVFQENQIEPESSTSKDDKKYVELTKSINNLLARQTMGNQLTKFDGSSYLKWPIFRSQYKITNTACNYSSAENVLRLNNSLTGQARQLVEMLLITAQKPEEILDILEKKYGKPELILEEILSKANEMPTVDDLQTFESFGALVRNFAAVMENDMGNYVDQRNILTICVNKLPAHLLTQWGSYLMQNNIKSRTETLRDFAKWVQEISDVVSRITFVPSSMKTTPCIEQKASSSNSNNDKTVAKQVSCKICHSQEYHPPEKCNKFQNENSKQRWKIAQRLNLCYGCLRSHKGKCRNSKSCGVNGCQRFHHPMLHKEYQEINSCIRTSNKTLLKIVPVQLKGPTATIETTAFLNEGSTTTLIEASIAHKIGLSGPVTPLCCKWTGDILRYEPNSQKVDAEIAGKNASKFHVLKDIRTVEDLNLPNLNYNIDDLATKFTYIRQVNIDLRPQEKPTLLIGQNNADLITTRQVIQPLRNAPILSKTTLGWTVHGPVDANCNEEKIEEIALLCCENADETLHELVKNYMKLENIGNLSNTRKKSEQEERALAIAEKSIKYVSGQYVVKLPWKKDNDDFPESKSLAMQRLLCLERKLAKNQELADAYRLEIQKLFEKNYAELVDPIKFQNAKHQWFLPHFAVTNPNKPGKVRVVFDAAAKSQGSSLNDFLLTGPDLLASLFGILLKFRLQKFAVVGDIREMFNRVRIDEEDTYAQCFLWRDLDRTIQPKVYKMTAMLFGATSSPFLAQFVKNYNAQKYNDKHSRTVKAITTLHYVDDYLDTFENEEKAIEIVNQVIQIHAKGGFEIRNFTSNSSKILENIPQHLLAPQTNSDLNKNSTERILGMMWESQSDVFNFKLNFHKVPKEIMNGNQIPTKRQVLRTAMSVYDPLGLLSPITIRIRILLQSIWRAGIGWDDCITQVMHNKWLTWLKELNEAMQIKINRCYSNKFVDAKSLELHTFSDASEQAYAAAVYLRIIFENSIEVCLVASKARVCPLKTQTIPKLELTAALTGVKLSQEVHQHLDINIQKKYYWSDSTTVLRWLHSEKRLPTFIATRVGEILEYTEVNEWHWVPTGENVSDDCTRETSKGQLNAESSWFKGPKFLYCSEEEWPQEKSKLNEETEEITAITEEQTTTNFQEILPEIKNDSTWLKIIRITAWVRRPFLIKKADKEEKQFNRKCLTIEELEASEKLWCRAVQSQSFDKDIKNLENKRSNKSGRLHNLSVYLDSEGLLRVASRIIRFSNEEASLISNEPIVLDGSDLYTQKIILYYHEKNAHQGVETVINELRRKFWIPKIRSVVKKIIKLCPSCRRKTAQQITPVMGLLPEERLMKYEKPFTATGVDYFGPFTVKIGRRIEKRYGVLFTCLTVRAIHVEIAHSLSTDSCILAIRRFLARRGQVKVMMSDNGTNLRGASRELLDAFEEVNFDVVGDTVINKGIKWKFIPPVAPHMGGCWERLIGCFKRALLAILKERNPTEEVLQTFFLEAEYIINSRPITSVSDNCEDNIAISPNDILIGKSADIIVPGHFTKDDMILKKQWRLSQYLADIFWKRWLREYLPTLVNRSKWQLQDENVKEGDFVIINDYDFPRGVWPLGVIEKVYEGEDKVVRVVDVRTKNGTFRRPVRKLYRFQNDSSPI